MSKSFSRPTVKAAAPVPTQVLAAQEAFRDNEALLAALETSVHGLDEERITERLHRDGPNEVSHEKPPHWSLQLLRAFKNPIIIAVMVGISVLLSFTQEYRSSRAAEKLKAMVRNTATVTRQASDGHSEQI